MRHTRQVRLQEVGARGQARIAAACASLHGDGLAGLVEARYLAGAGVAELCGPAPSLDEARRVDGRVRTRPGGRVQASRALQQFARLDPAAREVALGAFAALGALRTALDGAAET